MIIDRNVAILMRDGAILRGDVFLPDNAGPFPVLITFGPYGKDVPLREFMPEAWDLLLQRYPEILASSSGKHLVWETPDPEAWIPDGYVVIRVDARGAGKSPGRLDPNSPAEFRDFYDAIEWAGSQPWCNGKVGLTGISYHAAGQWRVASLKPRYLAALLPWQGTYDFYSDRTRQDGIFGSGFVRRWWTRSVLRNQHGNADSPYHDIFTGERTTGPARHTAAELGANRADYVGDILAHPLNDAWYRERTPDLASIDYPTLVVANWGGLALHLRGTIGGYIGIASPEKWLKVQSGSYIHTYLQPKNVALQKRFFDRYLKGKDNGWEKEPRVEVEIRTAHNEVKRIVAGTCWPLPETQWTRWFLDAAGKTLVVAPPSASASTDYQALSAGVTFASAPLAHDTEFAGPVKLKLFVSSSTQDMDIFATLCAFDPEGREITFRAAIEPKSPVSQGWLRVSQRRSDPERSTEYLPFHPHDLCEPLTPDEIYEADIEIWPMSLWLEKGSRLTLTIQGKDFERPGETGPYRGVGWMTHDDPTDRPPALFSGINTLHTGGGRQSWLLLPVLSADHTTS
jgi:predicted acyl esterase